MQPKPKRGTPIFTSNFHCKNFGFLGPIGSALLITSRNSSKEMVSTSLTQQGTLLFVTESSTRNGSTNPRAMAVRVGFWLWLGFW